jgi:spore coat polysaccharide biosynthesis protein SpsF
MRWTVDRPEDFEVVSAVYRELYSANPQFTWHDVMAFLGDHPELTQLNARFRRNESLAKQMEGLKQ